jgi:glycogen synthase
MRILFLSNFYPPHGYGGEEVSCQQVVEGLRQRRHATLVLTSLPRQGSLPLEADGLHQSLYLEMDLVPWRHGLIFFTQRKAREQHDLECLEDALEQFKPDVIFIWGMWNLPRSLAALAETKCPGRVVYRFASYWPTLRSQHEYYWRAPGRKWYSQLAKKTVGQVALAMLARENHTPLLAFEHAICVSAATRTRLVEAGIPIAHARVIHTGIDARGYLNDAAEPRPGPAGRPLRLLYAGRLVADKGVDTAIQALEMLVRDQSVPPATLGVVGSGLADYESALRQQVTQAGLSNHVTFLGRVPAEEMPRLLQQFDVLLLPSRWVEPFSRMLLEGMSAGLVVVATPTGGTVEIVRDGQNGLLFAPGNAEDLAEKLARLANDPALLARLAEAGRRTVSEAFSLTKMLDEYERFLHEVVAAAPELSLAVRPETLS